MIEKATHSDDLPHAYERAGIKSISCRCGKSKDDEIHSLAAREIAADQAKTTDILLGRELGT